MRHPLSKVWISVFSSQMLNPEVETSNLPSNKWKKLAHLYRKFMHINSFLKTVSKWMSLYKSPLYYLFWPLFCHMYVHLSQNWGSDGHFEVLNRCYLWWFKSNDTISKYFHFFSFFAIFYKSRRLYLLLFLRFCVFCHNFCTN